MPAPGPPESQKGQHLRYKNAKPSKRSRNPKFVQPYENYIEVPLPYNDLDSASNSFRLLRLLPSSSLDSAALECQLYESPIARQVRKYTALSYHWGDAGRMVSILVNGFLVLVRNNLYEFLRSCQRRRDWSSFWIDAICINQDNDAERSAQVEIMNSIYASAARVYIWLGPSKPMIDWLFDTLNSENTHGAVVQAVRMLQAAPIGKNKQQLKQAWLWILQREYWGRMWIVQEVLLAKDVTVVCGDRLLSWDSLEVLDDVVFPQDSQPNVPGLRHYQDIRLSKKAAGLLSLEELIIRHADRRCHYKHDRVYSLLGISDDYQTNERKFLLKPNYGISLDALFFQVMDSCASKCPIGFCSHLASLLGLTEEITSKAGLTSKQFTLSCQGTLGRRLTEQELATLSEDPRQYRGKLVYCVDQFSAPESRTYIIFDEGVHLQRGALLYPFTLDPDRHNIAFGFQIDSGEGVGLDSVIFGLWTNVLIKLPPRKLFKGRVDFVEAFLDAADVEFDEEELTLGITATFERWLKLFGLLHNNEKLPQSPWRRRGKQKLPLFEHDTDALTGKCKD